jgi:hypothetical protein
MPVVSRGDALSLNNWCTAPMAVVFTGVDEDRCIVGRLGLAPAKKPGFP